MIQTEKVQDSGVEVVDVDLVVVIAAISALRVRQKSPPEITRSRFMPILPPRR